MAPLDVLKGLAARGITRVLLEGGGRLAAAFLRADLVDRVVRFGSGCVIGGDGIAAVAALGLEKLDRAPRFVRAALEPCGEDVLETWGRAP
jgi:diaminohydroxyphosphoribosylaminopyrimidine deaminase/5-amino-6-(5-phosphoribosylamino)uracil reductase